MVPTPIQLLTIDFLYTVEFNPISFNKSSIIEILTNVTHGIVSDTIQCPDDRSSERKLIKGAQRKESGMSVSHYQKNGIPQRRQQRNFTDVDDSCTPYEITVLIEAFIFSCLDEPREPGFMCALISSFITIRRVDGSIISDDVRSEVTSAVDDAASPGGVIADLFV